MKKTIINPEGMMLPPSKYSHGVSLELSDAILVFVAGELPLDENGELVGPNDITAQTECVFQNIEKVLKASGSSLDDVIKATILVTDMKDFHKVVEVRDKYFANSSPASTFVEVSKLTRDDCLVEIEAIAVTSK